MALLDWLNTDKFGVLRDKVNAYKTLLQSGALGKVLVGAGAGNDPTWEDIGTAVLPDQAGNSGKYLKTNGTVASWQPVPVVSVDRQNTIGNPGSNYPISGQQVTGTVLASLTAAAGVNRDYLITATISFSRITTSPETIWCIYKNGVSVIEYKSVVIPVDGITQTISISHLDKNAAPGTVYQIRVKSDGNQIVQRMFQFIIDGYQA